MLLDAPAVQLEDIIVVVVDMNGMEAAKSEYRCHGGFRYRTWED